LYTRDELNTLFQKFLPKDAIVAAVEELSAFECDALTAYKQLPQIVLFPETVEQVQKILRFCYQNKIHVVSRGAGTSLSGGALPLAEGVLLSLAKFNRILKIDADNRTASVQAGVRNLAISQAASKYGLYYAPDPSSQIACTIGGNVAENAGGVHCLKYGLTTHNILELKVVTVEGEFLTIGSQGLDSSGYDLLALLTGSEGLLAVILEVTVKLLPKPDAVQVILAGFDSVVQAGSAVAAIIAANVTPSGLEMMDNYAIRAAEEFAHAGYPVDAAAILICELDGASDEVAEESNTVLEILKSYNILELQISKTEEQCLLIWSGRKGAFPAIGRIAPDYYCMDGTIPRKYLAPVLEYISNLSAEYNLKVANVFHAGDGNLHPLILYDANIPGELEKTEKFGAKILEMCVKVGGSITGEHGVGVEKINQMCLQFNTLELEQFHRIKHAFDSLGLLNPGKAIPTLHRCAELGAMHVHNGELPFPDIERF